MDAKHQFQYQAPTSSFNPKRTRQPKLTAEVSACIHGKTVDLSGASEFHRREWDIYRPALSKSIEDRGANRYEFSPKFFSNFEWYLRYILREGLHHKIDNPGDLIISAVGYLLGEEMYGRELHPEDLEEWPIWPSSRPISESWHTLGSLRVPSWVHSVSLEQPVGGKWRRRITVESEFPMVKIEPFFSKDKKELPKLIIQVEGQPVCLLMKAQYKQDDETDRAAAKQLWKEILRWSSVLLGFTQAKSGRPKTDLGRNAAFLRYHLDWPWPKIAERLCPLKHTLKHTHSFACQDNLRTLNKQYWTRLRKAYSRPGSTERN
jgi:hypothetical protein